jgi:hypothetical protein
MDQRKRKRNVLLGSGALVGLLTLVFIFAVVQVARDREARTRRIRRVSRECPSVERLVAEHFLDASAPRTDQWGAPLVVRCEGAETIVTSPGPDGVTGTNDDIRVTASAR